MEIKTLKQFIDNINETIPIRRQLAKDYLAGKAINEHSLEKLRLILSTLQNIPKEYHKLILELSDGTTMKTEANYEISELEKDLYFFEKGEDAFLNHLGKIHNGFQEQFQNGLEFLSGIRIENFITDRDGTVNNYCARYNTSVQSAYNAIFLSRYASTTRNSVLLTSAPLENKGLADISVLPSGNFILAGSKGREYVNANGEKGNFPIPESKQKILDKLNNKLSSLLNQGEYSIFSRIGSGLQFKFGQTTIARQDINGTIKKEKSEDFLKKINSIVREIDPEKNYFMIEDTGMDIEIILTVDESGSEAVKDFDKGEGISFLNESLNLNLETGINLICGDTYSDIPMLEKSMKMQTETRAIFVTTDGNLQNQAKIICPQIYFVNTPDILISILNQKAKE